MSHSLLLALQYSPPPCCTGRSRGCRAMAGVGSIGGRDGSGLGKS